MAFQKFTATQLFDGYRILDEPMALILSEEGIVEDILPIAYAGDDIQQLEGILSPGFINCHCHLELSHMKGLIEEGGGLIDFVSKVITQRHFKEDEILTAIEKAEDEMLENGIVAVGDICNNHFTIQQKRKGRIYYHNFIEVAGFNPAITTERFEKSVGLFREFATQYSIPVESNSIVPHAPYSVADELWKKIIHFPGNHLLTIHNQETEAEDQLFQTKQGGFIDFYRNFNIDISFFHPAGKSSLQFYLSNFINNQQVILVHNVFTTEDDIAFSKQSVINDNLYWCFCPNANQYISNQMPPVNLLERNNCNIVLGTDSLASNKQLSILKEIETIKKHFPEINTATLLQWATSNGAKALQINSLLGSFEKGKNPGLLLINEDLSSVKRLA